MGRERERTIIKEYLHGSDLRPLYVCGTPGTGKTALITEELSDHLGVFISCISDREFFDGLSGAAGQSIGKHNLLEWTPAHAAIFVFDEVDQLAERHPKLFRAILEWPRLSKGAVKVICIANTIDLTIKHLPADCPVNILRFESYGVDEITKILSDRLHRCNEVLRGVSLVQPQAIELCARKIASTGDLRKAFEIMGKAISYAQEEASSSKEASYLANLDSYFKSVEVSSNCLINFAHVAKAIEDTINRSTLVGHNVRMAVQELNIHQRIVLIALCLLTRSAAPRSRLTVTILYEKYLQLVTGIIEALPKHDCLELISHLETLRLLSLTKEAVNRLVGSPAAVGKRPKTLKVVDWTDSVTLCLDRVELEKAIGDASTILKSLLCE